MKKEKDKNCITFSDKVKSYNVPMIWNEWEDYDEKQAQKLASKLGVPEALGILYLKRGLDTPEKVKKFCELDVSLLHDPFLLPDMPKAVDRILKAIENKEHIHVHGDYDVDGITSTAVIVSAFQKMGANFTYHTPHRTEEGYDIKEKTVRKAVSEGATLIMTVDCGVVAFDAAEKAKELGVDLIVTDHHTPKSDETLPDCYAVINPNRLDSTYPFKGLAGVGVAFKLVQALCERRGIAFKSVMNFLMEYVALGTVADVAPITDENRFMVAKGCQLLQETKKPGLQELFKTADIKTINTTAISFFIAPRLNAIGRLSDSNVGLALLLETSAAKASRLAKELHTTNLERQKAQEIALEEVACILPDTLDDVRILVLSSPSWHPGLIGLIAGKLAENLGRPTLVCSVNKNGMAKGSCRSIKSPPFNILKALKSEGCENLFVKCGGHAFAAGFELKESDLPVLRERLNFYAKDFFEDKEICRYLNIDARLFFNDITPRIFHAIQEMAPFGEGNPEPIFVSKMMKVASSGTVGADGKHLKLKFKDDSGGFGWLNAMAYRRGHDANLFPVGCLVDVVYKLSMDSFRGQENLTMVIDDIKLSENQTIDKNSYLNMFKMCKKEL